MSPGRTGGPGGHGKVFAVSDLHVRYADNREVVERLHPESQGDWLLVAGDVGEYFADVAWALQLLAERFALVVWTPGNHELWTVPHDPVQLRGRHRYERIVELCSALGVVTPEDDYPVWEGAGGPAVVAPLFVLYDYTFRPPGARSKAEALDVAYERGVVCTDEYLLHPDPHPSREDWCAERLAATEPRLAALDPDVPAVLVNHYPLVREPTDVLRYPEFALWCGTAATADWHRRFNVASVVYGHLHIPRLTWADGVPFEEVSLGYPAERRRYGIRFGMRQILPRPS